ncbi:hypothetical protein RRG08_044186 [Elysia crispata]|uniref:Uncharacterized protein n=1 Tax=Elysia crispata TaxID=231223 RepID=A0AAE0XWT2_9GAST|nr:hypothetical protein RRG08_044186 [Elysia crispata]
MHPDFRRIRKIKPMWNDPNRGSLVAPLAELNTTLGWFQVKSAGNLQLGPQGLAFPSLLLEYPIASVPISPTLSSTSPSNQANINQGKRNKQSVCGVSPSSAPSEPLVRSRARFLRSGSNTVAILSGS